MLTHLQIVILQLEFGEFTGLLAVQARARAARLTRRTAAVATLLVFLLQVQVASLVFLVQVGVIGEVADNDTRRAQISRPVDALLRIVAALAQIQVLPACQNNKTININL